MNLSLKPEDQDFIEEQVRVGHFASEEDVVGAALDRLRNEGEFEESELDALIAEGEADIANGHVLSVEEVRENLRRHSREFREGRGQ